MARAGDPRTSPSHPTGQQPRGICARGSFVARDPSCHGDPARPSGRGRPTSVGRIQTVVEGRPMASPDKVAAVAELKERFSSAAGVVLTEYRGLSVPALQELRRALGEDATYRVSKNTLTKIAAKEAGVDGIDELLSGPTAIAFIEGDPVNVAKGLRDVAKDNPALEIKGGVLDGKVLSIDEVKKLASLESREVLLGKLASGLKAAQTKAAGTFVAPLSKAARLQAALV